MPIFQVDVETIAAYAVGILVFFIIGFIGAQTFRRWIKRNMARRKHELDRAQMKKRWAHVQSLLNSKNSETHRLAVIEADKLLDVVLKAMNMPGENFATRMNFAQKKYYELKKVRWAHSLRNKLVHEADVHLPKKKARAAVKSYERALKLLGAL